MSLDPYPERITMALDAPAAPGAIGPLEGPGVDEFCGVQEPTVDLWETGEVIPSNEELALLAELTGYPVEFFFQPAPTLDTGRVFLCVIEDPGPPPATFVARPRPRPAPYTPRPRKRVTAPAGLPECTGCGDPMRRATWTAQAGRCTSCGPTH